jgi:hypothetical protein
MMSVFVALCLSCNELSVVVLYVFFSVEPRNGSEMVRAPLVKKTKLWHRTFRVGETPDD